MPAIVLLAAVGLDARLPAPPPLKEAEAKAAFLYNLPLFVEWPPEVFAEPGPLVVGFAAPTPVADALRPAEGRTIRNRVLTIRPLAAVDDPRGCHILFVPAMDERASALLLARLKGTPVFTVGEDERFTTQGGILRLFIKDARLRMDVNLSGAEAAGLKLSSKLLGLANVVRGGQ
jgi:uncharacterized protein DUF4154